MPTRTGVRLTLHIQPRASRTELAGTYGDALKIRLASPPVDGAANDELCAFLGERLDVPRSAVVIRQGQGNRRKLVDVSGVNAAVAARLLLGRG
jgi:uncharacterized protein (TIGR00251 family)